MCMKPFTFAPRESPTPRVFYVIYKGLVVYGTRLLTSGHYWGEQLITETLSEPASASCITYVAAYALERTALWDILDSFPRSRRRVRRYAMLLALRTEMFRLGRRMIYERDGAAGSGEKHGDGRAFFQALSGTQGTDEAGNSLEHRTCIDWQVLASAAPKSALVDKVVENLIETGTRVSRVSQYHASRVSQYHAFRSTSTVTSSQPAANETNGGANMSAGSAAVQMEILREVAALRKAVTAMQRSVSRLQSNENTSEKSPRPRRSRSPMPTRDLNVFDDALTRGDSQPGGDFTVGDLQPFSRVVTQAVESVVINQAQADELESEV